MTVSNPRRVRDACYRRRNYQLVYAPRQLVEDLPAIERYLAARRGARIRGRWPYRGVGPPSKIDKGTDPFDPFEDKVVFRIRREWVEPAW